MEYTEDEKNVVNSIKRTEMRKMDEVKKEPLWKLNLIFTDFEIFFRDGKPLKWFTWKKAAPFDIDGDIIICRKRFHKYNRKNNSITRYAICIDVKDKCYGVVRGNTFYKGTPKDENGKKLVYHKKMSKKEFSKLVSILDK